MDSLVESLCVSFKVDDKPNNTSAAHPYFSEYYKCKNDTSNQASRRKAFLQAQKEKRNAQHNSARNIIETEEIEETECMEWTFNSNKATTPRTRPNHSKDIRNILMESEWLVDVPEDLDLAWTAVICPQGKRCVLVAQGRTTSAYDKTGHKFLSFPSWLPSGSDAEAKESKGVRHHRTILDCVYSFTSKTFFILDVIQWNSHPFFNCETNFRFYWLSSKIDEIKRLSEKSKVNPYSMRLALRFPTTDLESRMAQYPMLEELDPKVDGILFYHNETHYTPGTTPLVGWLKPFMIPEMLKILVHPAYQSDIPPNYQSAVEFIQSSLTVSKHKFKGPRRKNYHQKESESGKSSSNVENKVMEAMEEEVSSNDDPPSELSECCDISSPDHESMDDQSHSSAGSNLPIRKRKMPSEIA